MKKELTEYFRKNAQNTGKALVLKVTEYSPEADGFEIGNNNGNYEYGTEYAVGFDGSLALRGWSTSDGDITVPEDWQPVKGREFATQLANSIAKSEENELAIDRLSELQKIA